MFTSTPQTPVCPFCRTSASPTFAYPFSKYECPRCGKFEMADFEPARPFPQENRIRVSGWVREQNAVGVIPRMTREIVARVSLRTKPSIRERAHEVLKVFARKYPSLDAWVTFDEGDTDPEYEMLGVSYSRDIGDLEILLELLVLEQCLEKKKGGFSISVVGLLKVEEFQNSGGNSAVGFVAMDFNPTMNDSWVNGFEPAIHAAGFSALRISDKDYVGGITDQIMAEIRRARFVVADYTGQKAGVYFEAGFALGLNLTVIPTCRADEIDKLHFDIKHLNTLLWNEPSELADKLAKRIRAVVGSGPNLIPEA
jgi:hypothetical protein